MEHSTPNEAGGTDRHAMTKQERVLRQTALHHINEKIQSSQECRARNFLWLNRLQSNKSLKPTVMRVTPFAKKAKPAPPYGGLVPPFCDQ